MDISDNDINPSLPGAGEESEPTLSALSAFGGGDVDPEGQPLGLDPDAGRAKLSGSTLAVGVVVVIGIAVLAGMKMTLKAIASDDNAVEAIQLVEAFMVKMDAAEQAGAQGPIQRADGESTRIISELESDPTQFQVPPEQVQKNPFALTGVQRPERTDGSARGGPSAAELEAAELERLSRIARGFKIGSISGTGDRAVVFINGSMYRMGDEVDQTGFTIAEVDGLDVIVRVPTDAPKPWAFRLRYE